MNKRLFCSVLLLFVTLKKKNENDPVVCPIGSLTWFIRNLQLQVRFGNLQCIEAL